MEEDLEFDHIDPSTKVHSIASMLTVARKAFEKEVAKCQLLCKVHHQEKSRQVYSAQPRQWTHGKSAMYLKGKCRCDPCVLGQRERRRNEPARRKGTEGPGGPGEL